MSVPYTRIPLLSARRLSSSYTEQVCCTSSVTQRKSSVGRTHVRRLFLIPMSCMSSSKTIISSLFGGHDCSPYSIQIDSKHTNFKIWRKLCLNPYSEQLSYMSKGNTRISTLVVSHVNILYHRMAVCQSLNRYALKLIK